MTPAAIVHQGTQSALVLLFFALPLSLSLANVAMLLTLVFWLLGWVWGSSRHATRQALTNPVAVPALALFFWVLLATLWSPASGALIAEFLQKYLIFLLLPLFISLLQDRATRQRCWQAFALSMLVILAFTWLSVWFDLPWTRTQNQGFGQDHTIVKDHISQGIMMSFLTVLAAYQALRWRTKTWSFLAWCVATLAAVSILFLSSGRTGYLALFLSMTVFGVFATGLNPRKLVIVACVMAAVLGLSFSASTQLQTRAALAWEEAQKSSREIPVTSVGARVEMLRFTLDKSLENPVFGHGTAAYPVFAEVHFADPAWCSVVCPHPHNQFTFFLFEQGAIGLALFIWFGLAIARHAWRWDTRRRAMMLGFLAIMVAASMTHSSFWLSTERHFFILITALLMAAAHPRAGPPVGEHPS